MWEFTETDSDGHADFSCSEELLESQLARFLSRWHAEASALAQVSPIPLSLEPGLWEWTSQNPTYR